MTTVLTIDQCTSGTKAIVVDGDGTLLGLELEPERPAMFDDPLTGTVSDLAAAMRGYEELGVSHMIFQYHPYTPEALQRLTEALHLYRSTGSR